MGYVTSNSTDYMNNTYDQDVDSFFYYRPCTPLLSIEKTDVNEWNLYPNPVANQFHITIDYDCDMHIINSQGQIMSTTILKAGNNGIAVEHLPNGLYVVRTSDGRHSKFIKQ